MKIGILTLPLHTNYGGLLQAFAVQKVLRDLGHEAVTLNIAYKSKVSLPMQLKYFITTFIGALIGRCKWNQINFPFNTLERNKLVLKHLFLPFMKKVMTISPEVSTYEEIRAYSMEQGFDAYVVGSDQVWRLEYCPNIGWYFLDFLDEKSKAKRIAYSASFGVDNWMFNPVQTDVLVSLARKFSAISVRESSGVTLCKDYMKVNAVQLVDPTMMLTPNDYLKLIELDVENTTPTPGEIFCYILDDSDCKRNIISEIEQASNYVSYKMTSHINIPPYASASYTRTHAPKPVAQWLRAIYESQLVVTDSFHGVVFSILFHKPFIVLKNKERGIARIETLLNTFGLKDRMCSCDSFNNSLLFDNIEWQCVEAILIKQRQIACSFLKSALSEE